MQVNIRNFVTGPALPPQAAGNHEAVTHLLPPFDDTKALQSAMSRPISVGGAIASRELKIPPAFPNSDGQSGNSRNRRDGGRNHKNRRDRINQGLKSDARPKMGTGHCDGRKSSKVARCADP